MHTIQCQCGLFRGLIEGNGTSNRCICYCTDCRAFARYFGANAQLLDAQGGTEIVQVAQPRFKLQQGTEHLAALRLSDKGMIRWYATCCKTPIGNTLPDPKMSFIGLIHSVLDHSRMDQDFGTQIAKVSTTSALGEPKPKPQGMARTGLSIVKILLSMRLTGQYKQSELFRSDGQPRVQPKVLTAQELAQLKRAD